MAEWSFDEFDPETDMAPKGTADDCDGVPQDEDEADGDVSE